jgi:hypothetical protein
MIIIIVLKLNSAVDQGQSLDHGSGRLELTRVIRIKVVIIIVLRPNSKVDPRQGSSHESSWSLIQANTRTKVVVIIVLKIDSVGFMDFSMI